jgi:hypothetical protein
MPVNPLKQDGETREGEERLPGRSRRLVAREFVFGVK